MSGYEIGLSVLTVGASVVAIVTVLTMVRRELRSSVSMLTQMEILLEEVELRLHRLDRTLDHMDGGQRSQNSEAP